MQLWNSVVGFGKIHMPQTLFLKQMKPLMTAVICIEWQIIKQLILMNISRQIKLLAVIVVSLANAT